MTDVWVLGSAAWDVVFEVDTMPEPGRHTTARPLGHRAGGSTANVARALASAGHHVRLVAEVGTDDLGTALLDELASYGVSTEYIRRHDNCTPETLVFVDADGERTIIVLDKWCGETVPVPYGALASAGAVFVGRFGDYGPDLAPALRRGAAHVVTAVPVGDADWYATVVVGSESEYPQPWLADPYRAALDRVGPGLRWAVVTRGERGADAYGPDGAVRIPPVRCAVVDATGAGDSFTAGLMHGLVRGVDVGTAGRLGAWWAARALGRPQSVPPRWAELGLGPAFGNWPVRFDGGGDTPP
jgi:sugar/nucleoside kinase (ribokinase family)